MKKAECLASVPTTIIQNILDTRSTIRSLESSLPKPKNDRMCKLTDPIETGTRLLLYDYQTWQRDLSNEFTIPQSIPSSVLVFEKRKREKDFRSFIRRLEDMPVSEDEQTRMRKKYEGAKREQKKLDDTLIDIGEELKEGKISRSQTADINGIMQERKLLRVKQNAIVGEFVSYDSSQQTDTQ